MSMYNRVDVSVYQKVKQGNVVCGDSYYYYQDENHFLCVVVDGLGSGFFAHESSQAVVDVIKSDPLRPTTEIIELSNRRLTGKRGVVLGMLRLDLKTLQFTYSSIGNIGLMTITSEGIKKRNIPMSGYLGGYPRQAKVVSGVFTSNTIFVMFSDGVQSNELTHHLFRESSAEAVTDAFRFHMDQSRDDDTTLAVIKYN
ncbi:indirect negative regulator of sigma-B activity [Amphibacillus indicireducens]|uniref:Phosphoserine phosphatase RsbX n=1 Tax=Amphibacillus indicireducens TaxID=1076330 RepID=A0ABP7VUY0_9BACI